MPTRATLMTEIRQSLRETSAHQYTDDELRYWINESMRDLSRRLEMLETNTTIATVAGTEEYTLPANILRLNSVEYFESATDTVYPLEPRDFNGMQSIGWASHTQFTGRPCWYTVWGYAPSAKIIVYPAPDVTAATIKIWYYKQATELTISAGTDSSTLDLPDGWYDLLKYYVEFVALRRQRDPRWQEAKMLYEERVQVMKESTIRHHNQVNYMYDDRGWAFDSWGW